MENSEQPINPFISSDGTPYDLNHLGLTKREYIATKILQGFISSGKHTGIPSEICRASINIADALLTQLKNDKDERE